MIDRRPAIFAIALLLLVGGSLIQIIQTFATFFFTDRYPDTSGFAFAFYTIWIPWAAAATCCGIAGAYAILRSNSVRSAYLITLGALLLPSLYVDGVRLSWSAYNFTFDIDFPSLKIGVSALGAAYFVWLWVERNREEPHRDAAPPR